MTAETTITILRRALCLIALGAYSVCLCFVTVLGLGYAFHPLLGSPWLTVVSIFLRWVPVALYFYLRHRAVFISSFRRGCTVALALASISLSYFLLCFSANGLSHFGHDFLECTMDMWPAIVMLFTVTRRSLRFPNSLSNAATTNA